MNHCCETLKDNLEYKCEQHNNNCPRSPFAYIPKTREFVIKTDEFWLGETWHFLNIQYCPFCGYKFPESLRDKYFDNLEKLGVNWIINPEQIPEEYRSDKWWNK